MLILTRKVGAAINIGEDIIVKVIDIQRGQVRIGITAPQDVHILRSELTLRDFVVGELKS